jgi:chromosome segregation ATPase
MSNKDKRESPLVRSVLALDNYLSELERVGMKINSTDMTSDFDVEYVQKLMAHFAECGQGVAEEVANLSAHLRESQARAEAVATGVSRQADLLNDRRREHEEKLEEFRVLGEKVRELNDEISRHRDDRTSLTSKLPFFETQLTALIDELEHLRDSARESRMKVLAKNAESLAQTLQAVRKKLQDLGPSFR